MSIQSVVVAGGGGNLAPSIIAALRQSSFKVTVLTRKSSENTFPSNVNVVKISDDYPRDEVVAALKGHDAVVSTVAPNQEVLIDAAVEAGIKRFIPSDFGSDNRSPEALAAVPMWNAKVDTVKYLKSKESSTFSWTAIINNVFFDWAFNVTKGNFLKVDVYNKKALVFGDGNLAYSASNLHQVGLAVRRVLEKPDETKNQYVIVESFTFTQNQLLDTLEKELGFKFERESTDGKEWLAEQTRQAAAGNLGAAFAAIFGWSVLYGPFKNQKEYANEKLDLPLENFDESVKEVAKGFKT